MGVVETIEGDLTEQDVDYIVQQCNCNSNSAKGLSKAIFEKFPETNIYCGSQKVKRREPGEVYVRPTGKGPDEQGPKHVVNLLGQNSTGRAKKAETREVRLQWFKQALRNFMKHTELEGRDIAFPKNIGCGLAGGRWRDYLDIIEWFAEQLRESRVFIVELPPVPSKLKRKQRDSRERKQS
eukprot:gb/GECG01006106.1/.p1 GENE.gb/GECG01006106.1/~~gb/GECG01006106.1/.p1  ORF type:complete len:181 (+),score=24.99 gb/GECG01006106.1/:1-543(+)